MRSSNFWSNIWLLIVATAGVVALVGYILYSSGALSGVRTDVTIPVSTQTYNNAEYGIEFKYPDSYVMQERDAEGSALRKHHTIVLMDKTAAANIPDNGEGPTTITVDIFQNDLEKYTPEVWIRNTSDSNFKLSPDQRLTQLQIAGKSALGYTWDGLYKGDSVVLDHKTNIIMVSATYNSTSDQIYKDFAYVLATLRLF